MTIEAFMLALLAAPILLALLPNTKPEPKRVRVRREIVRRNRR